MRLRDFVGRVVVIKRKYGESIQKQEVVLEEFETHGIVVSHIDAGEIYNREKDETHLMERLDNAEFINWEQILSMVATRQSPPTIEPRFSKIED